MIYKRGVLKHSLSFVSQFLWFGLEAIPLHAYETNVNNYLYVKLRAYCLFMIKAQTPFPHVMIAFAKFR